jgi:hypothetical protein
MYQSSQAYQLIKAGCAIELLLNHPEFESSELRLPDKLESAVNLGRHPDAKMFEVWQDCCENNMSIPKTGVNARGKLKRTLKIYEALEKLNRLESR